MFDADLAVVDNDKGDGSNGDACSAAAAEKLAKISRCYGLLGALAGLLAAILIA